MLGANGRTRGRRERFREWRRGRPFAGGVLLLLAGVLIAYVPLQFAFELMLVGGGYTFVGLLWAVGVSLTGAFVLYRPDLSTMLGVVGVAFSILSLLGALGGFLLGMLLGILGGNLCVAWRPEEGGDGDDGPGGGTSGGPGSGDDGVVPAGRQPGDGQSGSVDRTGSTADGGSASTGAADGAAAAGLRVASAARRSLHRLARRPALARRRSTGLDSPSRPTASRPGPIADTGTRAGPSKRLVVAVGLVIATSVAMSVLATGSVAGILGGDDRSTDTVDVGEIRLGGDGRICAAAAGPETYRVTITDARLHDVAVFQQRGGDAVRVDLPTVAVEEALVLHTTGENDGIRRLAATAGCTDADQTSRTVFRTRHHTGETLRASGGVTMLNLRAVDGGVPAPGGFRFVAPADGGEESGEAPGIDDPAGALGDQVDELDPTGANVTGVADRTEDGSDVVRTVTDEADRVNGTDGVADVGNATGDVPPGTDVGSNATGDVDTETDRVANATGDGARVYGGSDAARSRTGTAAGSNADGSAAGGADADPAVPLAAPGRSRPDVVG